MSRWTTEEDQYLLANYGKQEVALLAKVLDRSSDAVRGRFYRISRNADEDDRSFLPVEVQWFLERANSTLPIPLREQREKKGQTDATKLAPWTGSKHGGNAWRHTKTGYRSDLGITVRSGWEANVCRVLKSYAIPFEFEPVVFTFPVKRGNKSYKPDIWLPVTKEWIEVKGYFDKDSRIKMKRFKKYYPEEWESLTMIISKSSKAAREICAELDVPNVLYYQDISKAFKARIENWEGA